MDKKLVAIIEFFGPQRTIVGTNSITLTLTNHTTVADALNYVRKSYPSLTLNEKLLFAAVNHHVVPLETPLRANDRVSFIPAIGGG